jgi:hypothetical protein
MILTINNDNALHKFAGVHVIKTQENYTHDAINSPNSTNPLVLLVQTEFITVQNKNGIFSHTLDSSSKMGLNENSASSYGRSDS